jgi:hypothetical protein
MKNVLLYLKFDTGLISKKGLGTILSICYKNAVVPSKGQLGVNKVDTVVAGTVCPPRVLTFIKMM